MGPFSGRAEALCRASIAEAARVRWRQYREVWAYVEGAGCRRRAILRHFGDSAEPSPSGPCCDACGAVELVPELPPPDPGSVATLDEAILSVARAARPAIGRTTCAEILHGARTKKIARNSYDGLPAYGTSSAYRSHRRSKSRAPSLLACQALERLIVGGLIADVIAVIGSIDVVMGDVDR